MREDKKIMMKMLHVIVQVKGKSEVIGPASECHYEMYFET
jgi:hypothetical protein